MGRSKRKNNPIDLSPTNTIESSSSSTKYQQNPMFFPQSHKEPKFQKYKGPSSDIAIENWIKAYELIAKHYKWDEKDKVIYLTNYLKGEALNWFMESSDDEDEWEEVKENLIDSYGNQTCDPTKAMVELIYDSKIGIKRYFEEKKKPGVRAKMS